MTVPANVHVDLEFQDNRGFRANMRLNGFDSDISADADTIASIYALVATVAADTALMSNAKLIKVGFGYDFDYAQEPSSETGTYELVIQKARLNGGDGAGGFMHASVPAPKDALFLTTADNNLVVVAPTASILTNWQGAVTALLASPRGGAPFAQFFGGQLIEGKPRVRRVLQGA